MKKVTKFIIITSSVLACLVVLYSVAVFSNIPFIKKWRTIYIETAMSTMEHQWLATDFIPKSIIDRVLSQKDAIMAAQDNLESSWNGDDPSDEISVSKTYDRFGENDFFSVFDEIDKTSFEDYTSKHPDTMTYGYSKLLIDESGLDKPGTTIHTTAGDQVLAIDVPNGILIIRVKGSGYTGKLAIIKDSSKVKIAASSKLGSVGETVKDIADKNNAILAINASGFSDAGGVGNGGEPVGLIISGGKLISPSANNNYLTIGFDNESRLYIGHMSSYTRLRDAIEFSPAEIINGRNVTDGSTGFGIQPRTSVGQKGNGDVLLLTVDGRQVGYSIGCTVGDCAEIMLRYNALQASNVDGGSSTVMVFRGREITKPANGIKFGRYVPDAMIVEYSEK